MNKIVLLVGPSGSGKTTVGRALETSGYTQLVSHTTRPIREQEKEAVDYYFRTFETFPPESKMIEVSTYNNHQYGLSTHEILNKVNNGMVYAIVDKEGAEAILNLFPSQTLVFYLSITPQLMIERMKERNDKAADIHERLDYAYKSNEFDEPEFKHYSIDADTSVEIIKGFIEALVFNSL